jgi:hypothetical protein
MASGTFVNSGYLFGIAKKAYERAKVAAKHERSHESLDPLISIVFAAAAGEAFISEIGELAQSAGVLGVGSEPREVQSVARVLSEVEDARGTTNLKFLLAKLALAGEPFDKGTNPYQDFAILIEVRNSLMHLKFDRIELVKTNELSIRHPPVITKLRSKNVLADVEGGENTVTSWLLKISTPAVARWSCNATAAIVKDIVESIPASDLREKANLFYYRFDVFSPVS